jgi:hypothetical protein
VSCTDHCLSPFLGFPLVYFSSEVTLKVFYIYFLLFYQIFPFTFHPSAPTRVWFPLSNFPIRPWQCIIFRTARLCSYRSKADEIITQ